MSKPAIEEFREIFGSVHMRLGVYAPFGDHSEEEVQRAYHHIFDELVRLETMDGLIASAKKICEENLQKALDDGNTALAIAWTAKRAAFDMIEVRP